MSENRVFERLIDVETRYLSCREVVEQDTALVSQTSYDRRREMVRQFSSCARGEPRHTCTSPLEAVRNAQAFFNKYYRDAQHDMSDDLQISWALRCKRTIDTSVTSTRKLDVLAACKRSLLLLPIAQTLLPTNHITGPYAHLGWEYGSGAATLCDENNSALLGYYDQRCRSINLSGSFWKGYRKKYEGALGDYYDEVDWDLCHVMARGNLRDSMVGYGRNV